MKKTLTFFLILISCTGYGQWVAPTTNPAAANHGHYIAVQITGTTTNTHNLNNHANLVLVATGTTTPIVIPSITFSNDSLNAAGVGIVAIVDSGATLPVVIASVQLPTTSLTSTVAGNYVKWTPVDNYIILYNGQKLYVGATVLPTGSYINAYLNTLLYY
jgi:hypothetical protein